MQGGRLAGFLASVPLATRLLLLVNVSIYIWSLFSTDALYDAQICLGPVEKHQYLRIISNAYFHVNFLHIFFNMATFFTIGCFVEQRMGTLALLGQNILFNVLVGLTFLLFSLFALLITKDGKYEYDCAVGYSGIIFGYMMVEVGLSGDQPRSIFGCCEVPAHLYPWAMLLVLSLMLQNVSFFGHLAGIVVGFLYAKGLLLFILPRRSWILALEDKLPNSLTRWQIYVPYSPNDELLPNYARFIQDGIAAADNGRCFACSCPEPPRVPCLSCVGLMAWLDSLYQRHTDETSNNNRNRNRSRYNARQQPAAAAAAPSGADVPAASGVSASSIPLQPLSASSSSSSSANSVSSASSSSSRSLLSAFRSATQQHGDYQRLGDADAMEAEADELDNVSIHSYAAEVAEPGSSNKPSPVLTPAQPASASAPVEQSSSSSSPLPASAVSLNPNSASLSSSSSNSSDNGNRAAVAAARAAFYSQKKLKRGSSITR